MKVRELLSDESKWTKGYFARTRDGIQCHSSAPSAACWCLEGALNHCYGGSKTRHEVWCELRHAIGFSRSFTFLFDWNDAPERTFADVKALIDRLDI